MSLATMSLGTSSLVTMSLATMSLVTMSLATMFLTSLMGAQVTFLMFRLFSLHFLRQIRTGKTKIRIQIRYLHCLLGLVPCKFCIFRKVVDVALVESLRQGKMASSLSFSYSHPDPPFSGLIYICHRVPPSFCPEFFQVPILCVVNTNL